METRGTSASKKRRSRPIPDEIWEDNKEEVIELYEKYHARVAVEKVRRVLGVQRLSKSQLRYRYETKWELGSKTSRSIDRSATVSDDLAEEPSPQSPQGNESIIEQPIQSVNPWSLEGAQDSVNSSDVYSGDYTPGLNAAGPSHIGQPYGSIATQTIPVLVGNSWDVPYQQKLVYSPQYSGCHAHSTTFMEQPQDIEESGEEDGNTEDLASPGSQNH